MTRRITVPGHLGRLVTGNMSYTVMGTSERANRGYTLHVSWKLFAGIILVRPVFTWGLGESNQQLAVMNHFQIIGVQGLKIGHSNLLLQSVLYYCVTKPRPLCQVITRKSKNKCLVQTCIFFQVYVLYLLWLLRSTLHCFLFLFWLTTVTTLKWKVLGYWLC